MAMMRGCRFSFHVGVVTAAIAYIYFSTVFVFIDRWFGLGSSPGMLHAVVFTFLAVMCATSYRLAIYTDPGRVPCTYMPNIEDPNSPIHEIKRKGGDLRYCQKCSHYKPPRAHHCSICNRCVLRMVYLVHVFLFIYASFTNVLDNCSTTLVLQCKDHHCIWINNCVGHANYRIFFVFVVYAVVACFYSLVLLVGSITVDLPKDSEDSYGIIHIISALLLVPLSLALGLFFGWHIYLIVHNKTTIEYYEGVRAMLLAEKGGPLYSHPYNVGAYENLTAILGPNLLFWLWPTARHLSSGLRFRTKYDKLIRSTTQDSLSKPYSS